MKVKTFLKGALASVAFVALTAFAFSGVVDARTQYDPNGTATSTTPIFNEFYDVPEIGDEADFVRIRQGEGEYVDNLESACDINDQFMIRTYIHNGADPDYNEDGSGPAVARDVVLRMIAELNQTDDNFTFTSTVSASNAASVTDSATLDCDGNQVQLQLVPQSVYSWSRPLGWNQEPDSAVNGELPLGSREQGSGDVWACWDDRVLVVYEVQVIEAPQVDYVCDSLTGVLVSDKRYKFTAAHSNSALAEFVDYTYDFGDGNKETTVQNMIEHTYLEDGNYKISVTPSWIVNGETVTNTGPQCEVEISPTKIPDTGAGSVAALFAGVSVLGTAGYQLVARKRS